jgi:hypothetical protein
VRGAASRSVTIAKIHSSVKGATRRFALVAKVPSSRACNARLTSALIAESRPLALVNARISSAASNARSWLPVAARKARRVLRRRREYLVLGEIRFVYHMIRA